MALPIGSLVCYVISALPYRQTSWESLRCIMQDQRKTVTELYRLFHCPPFHTNIPNHPIHTLLLPCQAKPIDTVAPSSAMGHGWMGGNFQNEIAPATIALRAKVRSTVSSSSSPNLVQRAATLTWWQILRGSLTDSCLLTIDNKPDKPSVYMYPLYKFPQGVTHHIL